MNIKANKVKVGDKEVTINPLSSKESKELSVDFIQRMYKNAGMQFKLSDGTILGRLGISAETKGPLFLDYHLDRTKNFDDFIESINKFLSINKKKLSSVDVKKLDIEYRKYVEQMLGTKNSVSQQIVDAIMK